MAIAAPELADRLEIQSVLSRYAWALDAREYDRLDDVFTPDAFLDYTTAGGIKGPFPEVKAWLLKVMPFFPAYQHLISNVEVTFDGDTATSRAAFYNPMGHDRADGTRAFFHCGGEYRDEWTRTADGWRITNRFEQTIWMDGEFPTDAPV
ncbi:MAG: nuclear transport factor 2 family protein [Acidimicrobiia bacterium]